MENTILSQAGLSQAAVLTDPHPREDARQRRSGDATYLRSRNGLLVVAAMLGTIGFFAGWRWFGAAAVFPLLYVLPCAAMMLMCMRGHGGSATAPTTPDSNAGSGSDASQ